MDVYEIRALKETMQRELRDAIAPIVQSFASETGWGVRNIRVLLTEITAHADKGRNYLVSGTDVDLEDI